MTQYMPRTLASRLQSTRARRWTWLTRRGTSPRRPVAWRQAAWRPRLRCRRWTLCRPGWTLLPGWTRWGWARTNLGPHLFKLGESVIISTSWESRVSTFLPAGRVMCLHLNQLGESCVHISTSWESRVSTFQPTGRVLCPHLDQLVESCVQIFTSWDWVSCMSTS